jgi:hypothetical protein
MKLDEIRHRIDLIDSKILKLIKRSDGTGAFGEAFQRTN